MQIRNFNYFDSKQIADTKNTANASDQDFDLDLQTVDRAIHHGGSLVEKGQGSGHFWCHITDGCNMTASCVDCVK